MFTGLVEEMGTISQLLSLDSSTTGGQGTSLTISSCPIILSDAKIGDSIACNGTCLTITELLLNQESTCPATSTSATSTIAAPGADTQANPLAFKVTIAPETLRRTNLGSVRQGMKLNLERAARGDTRMGGHYVQGHVDAVAEIRDVREDGNAVVYRFSPKRSIPSQPDDTNAGSGDALMKYIVEKGYVSIDGASLTVTAEDADWWEVMLIPYTSERIVMGTKGIGDEVNVEVDMVGKYVEKSVKAYFENGGAGLPGLESAIKKVLGR